MRDYYSLSTDPHDRWRLYGYTKAIAELKTCKHPIRTYEEAKALRSVGDSIAKHIVHMAKGFVWREDALADPTWNKMKLFLNVHGVGPKCARRWVLQGIETIEDAKRRGHPDDRQRIGLNLYDDLLLKIPRDEVTAHGKVVADAAKRIDPALESHIMGSYRRGASECGDIDVLISRPGLHDTSDIVHIWRKLRIELSTFITHDLVDLDELTSQQETSHSLKWLGVSRLSTDLPHRRLDILIVPAREIGAALLYFTGNALFNRSMRLLARRRGGLLSDKGYFTNVARDTQGVALSTGVRVAGDTEEGIFRALQIKWRKPSDRCALV